MIFRNVLETVDARAFGGDPDLLIEGITYDSRQVKPGFLFVAIKGFKADGHDYIAQAIKKGAAAIMAEREVALPPGTAWVLVPDSRRAMALLSTCFYGNPSSRMKMIGVTGTNGKTTTANLVAAVLKAAGKKTGLIGTIHNKIGHKILPVKHTTPEAPDLQKLLGEMATEGVDVCVMEVSSHALALHRVDGCEFDVAVFTNITQDHLDFHGDMEEYMEAKLKLFSGLGVHGVKKEEKYAVINADDSHAAQMSKVCKGNICTYGLTAGADVWAENAKISASGASFTVKGKWSSCALNLRMTGMFNVYNALAAFTASAVAGVPIETIKDALENVRGVPGRFEMVDSGQEFSVIVDYAHTPDGLENTLKTARQITQGRLITVFGCGGDRDRAKRPMMGEIAARYSDFAVLTSDNPRTEDPLAIIEEVEAGVRHFAGKGSYAVEPDRRMAIRLAVSAARRGDVVVIAGKGHEDYQIIGMRKFPFDDRLEAAAALAEWK